jgi:hypothetical protein
MDCKQRFAAPALARGVELPKSPVRPHSSRGMHFLRSVAMVAFCHEHALHHGPSGCFGCRHCASSRLHRDFPFGAALVGPHQSCRQRYRSGNATTSFDTNLPTFKTKSVDLAVGLENYLGDIAHRARIGSKLQSDRGSRFRPPLAVPT